MSDKPLYLSLIIRKTPGAEACLCSSRESAEQKLFKLVKDVFSHECPSLNAVETYKALDALVREEDGLPFSIQIAEVKIDGPWLVID